MTFYFESLGKMQLAQKRLGNVVKVWDSHGGYRFMVVIPDPALARQFMDAMVSMSKSTGESGR